jgi:hypothetical protein
MAIVMATLFLPYWTNRSCDGVDSIPPSCSVETSSFSPRFRSHEKPESDSEISRFLEPIESHVWYLFCAPYSTHEALIPALQDGTNEMDIFTKQVVPNQIAIFLRYLTITLKARMLRFCFTHRF